MKVSYVGIDWGSEKHAVCVMNEGGAVEVEMMVSNDALGLARLRQRAEADGRRARFAVESKDLPFVETLIESGCEVFTINPKQADRFRDRFGPSGAKDDRRDARVLASALRTDEAAFRRAEPVPESEMRLRLRARAVGDLEGHFRAAANQLVAALFRYFPALLELCPGADQPWVWRLLQRAPNPAEATKLAVDELAAMLKECRVRRLTGVKLHEQLQRPPLCANRGVVDACAEEVLRLVDRLLLLRSQKAEAEKLRDQAVEAIRNEQEAQEGRDVELLASMPGAGPVVVATLLGEAGALVRERNRGMLRAVAGLAPVTRRSGKSTTVSMRRARNGRLANALFHAARVAAMKDERFKTHLAELRQRGHSYGRALRGVADRYLDVLFGVLRAGTPYDPTHGRDPQAPQRVALAACEAIRR